MDKPIPEAVVGRAHLQAVLNLSEAARCLGVAQAKNDQGAIDYWTDKTNEYEAALTAAQQQGQGSGEVVAELTLTEASEGLEWPAARLRLTEAGRFRLCAGTHQLYTAPPSAPDYPITATCRVCDCDYRCVPVPAKCGACGADLPPSAPVGVDAPGSRAWMAEVCRAAALSLATHGVRNDQLSKVADWIAQQPAAVDGVLSAVRAEVVRATGKFPTWPTDPMHASGVVQEESGELAKAVLQAVYEPHKSTPEDVATEAFQTAAMAVRFLLSMDRYDWQPGVQHDQNALDTQHQEPTT